MSTSAWKTDDKAWMKQRRADWKGIKEKFQFFYFIKKGDINKLLKSYFMTGIIPSEAHNARFWQPFDPVLPLRYFETPTFLDCWLHPDRSDENWERIKESYGQSELDSSAGRFLELSGYMVKKPRDYRIHEGDFFQGLEERLYRLLCPTRCRREDYRGYSEESFLKTSERVVNGVLGLLNEYLCCEVPNGHYVVLYRFEELFDALNIVPPDVFKAQILNQNHFNKQSLLQNMTRILSYPDDYPQAIVKVANKINDFLVDPALPAQIQSFVQESVNAMPMALEYRVIPGSHASLYIECESTKMRNRMTELLHAGENKRFSDKGYERTLVQRPWPLELESINKNTIVAKFYWHANSVWEIKCMSAAIYNAKCKSFYGYFVTSHEPAPAYYRIDKDGKLHLIYHSGQDVELDKKINTFDDPGKGITLVVESVSK